MSYIRIVFKSIIIGLLVSLLIMPCIIGGAEARENVEEISRKVAQEYFRCGLEYAKRNEFKLAIEQYDRAIAVYPGSADYYLKRGEAFFKNQQIAQSIEDFTKVIKIQPKNYEAYFNRARSYVAGNQKDKAITDIKQTIKICTDAIKRNPKDTEKYINRGQVYMMLDDYDNAAYDFSKVIELNPQSDAAYIRRGIVYGREYKFDLAIADFSKAIKLNSSNDEAFLLRGDIYFFSEKIDQAIQNYSDVIRLKPNDPIAHAKRSFVYMMSGEVEKAHEDYQRAESIDLKTAESIGWIMTINGIGYAHITGNVPEKDDFERLLLRDIKAYFNANQNAEIKYEFLRKGPDQIGVSPPDYYFWVEINDNGNRHVGAMKIAAIDKKTFVISEYLTQEAINKNFSDVYKIFPFTVCVKIANKI